MKINTLKTIGIFFLTLAVVFSQTPVTAWAADDVDSHSDSLTTEVNNSFNADKSYNVMVGQDTADNSTNVFKADSAGNVTVTGNSLDAAVVGTVKVQSADHAVIEANTDNNANGDLSIIQGLNGGGTTTVLSSTAGGEVTMSSATGQTLGLNASAGNGNTSIGNTGATTTITGNTRSGFISCCK